METNQNKSEPFLSTWLQLIQGSPAELESAEMINLVRWNMELSYYRQVLSFYFSNDAISLNKIYIEIKSVAKKNPELESLELLSRLRFDIRAHRLSLAFLSSIENLQFPSVYQGEFYIILAYAFHEIERSHEAKIYYLKAYEELQKIGATKKALRALQNYLAVDNNYDLSNRHIDDFMWVYKEARKLKANGAAGIALINIAREFQILNIYDKALRFVVRGRALLRYEKYTVQYYLSLLFHAHILFDLKKTQMGNVLLEQCRNSGYYEINGCIKVIESIRDSIPLNKVKFNSKEKLMVGWSSRWKEENSNQGLGYLESVAISFLSMQSRTRVELSYFLYGDKLDNQILSDRLKTLLFRIRKKWPDLIISKENGQLSLSGQGFLNYKIRSQA